MSQFQQVGRAVRGRQSAPIPETERETEKAKQDAELGVAV